MIVQHIGIAGPERHKSSDDNLIKPTGSQPRYRSPSVHAVKTGASIVYRLAIHLYTHGGKRHKCSIKARHNVSMSTLVVVSYMEEQTGNQAG